MVFSMALCYRVSPVGRLSQTQLLIYIVININLTCNQQNLNVTEHLMNVLEVKGTNEQKDENENEIEEDKAKPTRIKISLI